MNSPSPANSSPSPRFPTFRKLFSARIMGRISVALAVLATLIAVVLVEENWRGKLAWQRYKRQLEAQGEKFDWKDFVPPPVPDEQNFAMTPFLAPLFDFNPRPLAPGQSPWRDPNEYSRVNTIGEPVAKYKERIGKRETDSQLQEMTDLQMWARALSGKLDEEATRALSREGLEAFRRRYGIEPTPTPAEPPPAGAPTSATNAVTPQEAAAAEEAFRRRYGLSTPLPAPPLEARPTPPATNAAPTLTRQEAAAEVLRVLAQYDPVLDELRAASRRPYARFKIRYEGEFAPAILLPHLSTLSRLTLLFQLRASAELALGQADKAWADTQMALYLAETPRNEPFVISRLLEGACVLRALRPIWEGLAEHQWSDSQLTEMQQRLSKVDLLSDAAMRGERAMNLLTVDQLGQMGSLNPEDPRGGGRWAVFALGGFFYQNKLFLARTYQQFFLPVVDDASQRVYPSRAAANEEALTAAMQGGFAPYRFLSDMLLPSLTGAPKKFAFGQTRVNEAIIACALERYRLAQGQFPDSLEALSPRFLQKAPHDIITGEPYKYRLTADGQFVLYSVGWNEKDEGGLIVRNPPKTTEPEPREKREFSQGDWVWQYPRPAQPTNNSR